MKLSKNFKHLRNHGNVQAFLQFRALNHNTVLCERELTYLGMSFLISSGLSRSALKTSDRKHTCDIMYNE